MRYDGRHLRVVPGDGPGDGAADDGGSVRPDWYGDLRDAYAVHNVIAMRPELPFFVLSWDGDRHIEWMDLSDPRQRVRPYHFEIVFGKEQQRDAHYRQALEKASTTGEAVLAELHGFWDLFYPLPTGSPRRTFLFAGQFYRESPTWDSLATQWRALTGHDPASADPDFVRFVRVALQVPVLEAPLLEAYKQFADLHARLLVGKGAPMDGGETTIQDRVDRLNRERISRLWPIEDWVESAISPDKFHLTPWYLEGELTDWMKEGMGIDRLPTTAMALMPLDDRDERLDPVRTLVRNAELQRACIALAREMSETAATRLGDYGISIITSSRRGHNDARGRVELRERAQKLQAWLQQRFHVRSVIGIGPTLAAGSPLHESHRAAVLALHMCVQLDRDVLFHDEHGDTEQLRYADLHAAADALQLAFTRESATEIKLASDRWVQLVLRYSGERTEAARAHCLAVLFQLFTSLQRTCPMSADARTRVANDLTRSLEEAQSLSAVIESFKEALSHLSMVSSRAWHGPSVMRLEAALQYIRENFAEPLPLPLVAKKAGFSVPAFSRAFRQATGTSFLNYLRAIRVEHAKRLLTTTPMTTELIAQACGFQSPHHLIRSFKKVTSLTPGTYRRAHANRD
jgi:AraC-like DNA-binding protein